MRALRILRAPCQRCGEYHDVPSDDRQPKGPEPLSMAEGLQLAVDGFKEIARGRPAPPPPDLAAAIRIARGGVR